MNILAVETSSTVAGAAVWKDGRLVAECYLDHRLTHSEIIMPMVEKALALSETEINAIDCFGVDVGPGSFTGVRIGVCCVNGMAAALKKPVAPVDSLAAVAENLPFFSGLTAVIADARGVQIYGGLFDTAKGVPEYIGERMAGTIDEFLEKLPASKPLLFAGDGAGVHRQRILEAFPQAVFAPAQRCRPRACAVAAAAARLAEAGGIVKEAMPLYLRVPQAQRMRENG